MIEVAASERLERAEKSLLMSRERLQIINRKLPELNKGLENLIVVSETERSKSSSIKKVQSEIQSLEKERGVLEQTISALQKALPTMEKAFRLETAENESLTEYQQALSNLQEFLAATPALNPLKEGIEKLQTYSDRLTEAQTKFFEISQRMNDVLIKENVGDIAGVGIETLNENAQLDYQPVLLFSDELISLSESLNEIQYALFATGTGIFRVTERPLQRIEESCACGKHRREFDPASRNWNFFELQQTNPMVFAEKEWVLIYRDSKPMPFPCEIEQEPVKPVLKKEVKEKAKSQPPVAMVFEDGLGTSLPN